MLRRLNAVFPGGTESEESAAWRHLDGIEMFTLE